MKSFDNLRRLAAAAAVCGAVLAAPGLAVAQGIPGYPEQVQGFDPREVALLPPYCIHTMVFRDRIAAGNDAAKLQYWRSVFGSYYFDTMHHYCWGLMKTNRALLLAKDPHLRQFYLSDGISEYDYVLNHVKDDFLLMPEVLTKKGENLVRLGRVPAALVQFERAVSIKPDYWPAHAQIADVHLQARDYEQAEAALKAGLEAAPQAKALQRRMATLKARAGQRKAPAER